MLKRYLKILLLLLSLFSPLSFAERVGPPYLDFVIDLDQVILYSARKRSEDTVKADDKHWTVAQGAEEFIESLSKIPNARISFFSARSDDRNTEAVKKIKISNGRSFYEVAEDRVYSAPHMRMEGQLKVKDFTDLVPNLDPNSAILIDDNLSPASKKHRKNLLWIYYRDQDRRLIVARGLIQAAIEKSKKEKMPLVEALYSLQYSQTKEGEIRFKRVEDNEEYIKKGLKLFNIINPKFKLPPADRHSSESSPTHKMRAKIIKDLTEAIEEANAERKKVAKKKKKKNPKLLEKPAFPDDCYVILEWIKGNL